jgi:tellurite resistance protein TehA-like permease
MKINSIKKKFMKKTNFIILAVMFGLWSQPALAYIDPGSGSAIMSAIIGILVAIALVVKTYWYKLKSLFMGKKNDQQINPGQEPEEK